MSESLNVIGVDESGKGDFFGPLVIASFLAPDSETAQLKAIGVRDSKKIADKKLLEIDKQLRQKYKYNLVVYMPDEYNRQYKIIKNLNKLLANGHASAIEALVNDHKPDMAISDKFGKTELIENALSKLGCEIDLTQMNRGEAIIQVAAASIIARAEYIRKMDDLSLKFEMNLPKGAAAHVDEAGRKLVEKSGIEVLPQVSKTHFKNYHRVFMYIDDFANDLGVPANKIAPFIDNKDWEGLLRFLISY